MRKPNLPANSFQAMYQERIVLINSNLSGITSSRVFINEHPIKQTGQYKRRNLRMAEHYLNEFGKLAKTNSTMIIPADLADVGELFQV